MFRLVVIIFRGGRPFDFVRFEIDDGIVDLDGTKMSVTHELVGSRLFINSLSQFKKSMCHKLRTTQTVLFENFKTNKER